MTRPDTDWLARYQPWRGRAEVGFWIVVLAIQSLFNSVVTLIDLRRFDPDFPWWHPVFWELTSAAMIGAMIPAVFAFERRFPLRWGLLRRHLPLHLMATVAFCAIHVVGMIALRKMAYSAMDTAYNVRSWGATFGYEYLKDVRSYFMILVAAWSYRLLLLRMQGEARVLDAPEGSTQPETPAPVSRPERFLVRKLRKEFLIAAQDIEWVQAQGNYVGLHVNGHDYLLRATLAGFLEQLDPARFAQVHRSYAVNLDRIAEIEPTDGGDARLKMKDGSSVPCTRRYREGLGR